MAVLIPMTAIHLDSRGGSISAFAGCGERLQGGGLPWPVTVLVVIGLGALVGLANGMLVERGIDSSSPRRHGTSSLGLNAWSPGGRRWFADLQPPLWKFPAISGRGRCRRSMWRSSESGCGWSSSMQLGGYLSCSAPARGGRAQRSPPGATHAPSLGSSPRDAAPRSAGRGAAVAASGRQTLGGRSILSCRPSRPALSARPRSVGRVNRLGTILAVAGIEVTSPGLNQLGATLFSRRC